jgi:hypothetical protein
LLLVRFFLNPEPQHCSCGSGCPDLPVHGPIKCRSV